MAKKTKTAETKEKLTHKQFLFAQGIIAGLTQTEAARQAGYKGDENQLAVRGSELVRYSKVKSIIESNQVKLAEKAGLSAEKVINELAKCGFSNIQDFLGKDNKIKDISEITPDLSAAVESIQSDIRHDGGESEGYTEKVKIKLYSKLDALDKLCRHLGLYKADLSVAGNVADIFAVVLNNISGDRQAIDSVASPTRHKQQSTHADIPIEGSSPADVGVRPILDGSTGISEQKECLNSQDGGRGGAVDENVER